MNKAEIIKGIDLTIDGLTTIKNALSGGENTTPATAPKTRVKTTTTETTEAALSDTKQTYTRAELDKMGYNAFKTFAAKAGVKCTGTRTDIMKRLEDIGVVSDGDTPDDENTTPAPTTTKGGKLGKKNAAPAEESASDTKSDKPVGGKRGLTKKTAEPATDEYDEQAKAIAEDTPVEDILSALADVGVKATKKNYLSALASALRDGLIEADDEEDESNSDEAEAEAPESEDGGDEGEDDTNYTPEFDPEGFNDPENMTEARHEAVVSLVDGILTDYSEGKLTIKKMTAFLESNCTQEELDLVPDEDDEDAICNLYIEIMKRMVDDEGEVHEAENPYELGGKDFCCGHPLKYVKKTKKFVCEVCGGEYQE